MNIQLVLLITLSVLLFSFGYIVIRNDPKNLTNRYFAFFIISVLVWVSSFYFSNARVGYEDLLNRAVYLGSSLIAFTILMLGIHFPTPSKLKKSTIFALMIPTLTVIGLIFFSNLIIEGYQKTDWGTDIVMGKAYIIYPIYFLIQSLATAAILIIKFRRIKHNVERSGIKLFILGLLISLGLGYFFNSLSYYLVGNYSLSRYGQYSIIVFIAFCAYAIVRHKLFNIKVLVTEISVGFLLMLLLIQLLLSKGTVSIATSAVMLILASFGGYSVIISVHKEIKQKEELEHLAKKLEEANVHLKELDHMKDDFLSMASHELNTPLAAIEGYLSMMLEEGMGGDLQPQAREYLDRVFASSQRLSEIVKGLLNVSRIESGRIHLIYELVQIEDVIKQAVAEIDPKIKEKKHTICMELPADPLPKSWMDLTRITEVVINLLGNSIKYTDAGGHIEIGAKEEKGELLVWVKDNGRGIPKDKADKVFQKFSQVDVLKDEVKGTGLGMFISQKFVELHKGKIWFESEGDGKGTTFFFSLPVLKGKPYDPHEGDGPVLR